MMSHIICTDGINCAVRTWPERQFPQAYEKNHRLRRAVSFSLPALSQTFSPFLFCPCHIFSLFSSYRHLLLSLPRSAPFVFIRQQAFLPALSQAFSCPSSFRPLRSAFPPLIFCLTFSPPHRIPPACTIFAFPLFFSFPCPCHLFPAPPSPAVISPLLRSPPSAAFPPLPLSSCDTKYLIFV